MPEHRGLTADAVEFLTELEGRFGPRRRQLLDARHERAQRLRDGELPDFLPETKEIREGDWRVAPVPAELQDRRVEITGPVDRKMVINALNSGAKMFMADFEDSNSPTWQNCIEGQVNLTDALDRTIELDTGEKQYRLNEETATLLVRPRGWHLEERHFEVDGAPMSASLFDFGLYFFRNHDRGGTWFYLPKLESHLEARLWNDVFVWSQERLGVPQGTIKATVLIETILAAFEMDEILYELREHSAGLNAGRWDYIFSVIKKLGHRQEFVLPDRADVTMAVPFMRAYTELLVKTCHAPRRARDGRHGRLHPLPPRSRGERRRAREGARGQGARGGPGLRRHLGRPSRPRAGGDGDLRPRPRRAAEPGRPAAAGRLPRLPRTCSTSPRRPAGSRWPGLHNNVSVGIQYLAAWLQGSGAVAIFNLMEDAATSEISRSQVWQWLAHAEVAREDVMAAIEEEIGKLDGDYSEARELFEQVALGDEFVEFLTLPAVRADRLGPPGSLRSSGWPIARDREADNLGR